MAALSVASKAVNQATASVVASVKSGQTTLNETGELSRNSPDPCTVDGASGT